MFEFYDSNLEYAIKKGNKKLIMYLMNKLLIMEQLSLAEYFDLFASYELIEQFKILFKGTKVLRILEV